MNETVTLISPAIVAQLQDGMLWACNGNYSYRWYWTLKKRKAIGAKKWLCLFASKEEAEAHAVKEHDVWVWDGLPASPRTVESSLEEARAKGRAGVQIIAYREGRWIRLAHHPADVPYFPDSDQK